MFSDYYHSVKKSIIFMYLFFEEVSILYIEKVTILCKEVTLQYKEKVTIQFIPNTIKKNSSI